MRNLKKNMGRYLGMGMTVLLVMAAVYLPQGWFALRDAASLDRVQEEVLAPLMVAQLDRSYERDIYQRMITYMEAYAQGDINCSSKDIDPGDESLWENINQVANCPLMNMVQEGQFVSDGKMAGWDSTIERCTQYVLIRQSDGQILLVANDIVLDKGGGCHMELLIDGVDGTVYYLESEENNFIPLKPTEFVDYYTWELCWALNDTYCTEGGNRVEELYNNEGNVSSAMGDMEVSLNVRDNKYTSVEVNNLYTGEVLDFASPWVSAEENTDTYCCLLTFGEVQSSWTMEIEAQDGGAFRYRIRMGLPGVVNPIPEMAERISLAEYDQIYDTGSRE